MSEMTNKNDNQTIKPYGNTDKPQNMKVSYLGSTKETRMIVLNLGYKFGCQHCRKMTIGDKIAELAINGNAAALEECKKYPQMFEVKE